MSTITVLMPDGAATVPGRIVDGRVVVGAEHLEDAIGWELKPEGLCRGDVCVPVRDLDPTDLDLATVAGALGSSVLVDADSATVAVSVAAQDRKGALAGRQAPDFTLPDLDGNQHRLEEFANRRRLLIAFASW